MRYSEATIWRAANVMSVFYLLFDITMVVLLIPASDYLICIFYWTWDWPFFKFQLLITSFVSFIGHYIGLPSHSSFWLPHLYLLLDITLAVLHIPASDYLICIFYCTLPWAWLEFQLLITSRTTNVMSNKRYKWGNQKLECEGQSM
jgi:hypothetical protein